MGLFQQPARDFLKEGLFKLRRLRVESKSVRCDDNMLTLGVEVTSDLPNTFLKTQVYGCVPVVIDYDYTLRRDLVFRMRLHRVEIVLVKFDCVVPNSGDQTSIGI